MTKNSEKLVCVKFNSGVVARIPYSQATALVSINASVTFCPKKLWKEQEAEQHEKNVKHEQTMREKKAESDNKTHTPSIR